MEHLKLMVNVILMVKIR